MVSTGRGEAPLGDVVHQGGWQLGDPGTRGERPGAIFRIGPDRRRALVAQAPVKLRTDAATGETLQLQSDLAQVARCFGLGDLRLDRDRHAPVAVTIQLDSLEIAQNEVLEAAVHCIADWLELGGAYRHFVVQACGLASSATFAMSTTAAVALRGAARQPPHVRRKAALPGRIVFEMELERPERMAFSVAEIRRTAAGLSLVPVADVLDWCLAPDEPASRLPDEGDRDMSPAPAGGHRLAKGARPRGSHAGLDAPRAGITAERDRGVEAPVPCDGVVESTGTRGAPPGARAEPPGPRAVPCDGGLESTGAQGAPPDAIPEPRLLHWNTRLLDGDRPVQTLAVGRVAVLETWLGPQSAAGAVIDTTVPADTLPEGTNVQFVIACAAPVLRVPKTTEMIARHAATMMLVSGATQPIQLEVVPDRAGPLAFELSLYTGRALRVRSRLEVSVVSSAEPALAPLPHRTPVALGALAKCTEVAIRIEIDRSGLLEVDLDPLHWGPERAAREMSLLADTAIRERGELTKLTEEYEPDPSRGPFGIKRSDEIMLAFANSGMKLHDALFGYPDDPNRREDLVRVGKTLAAVAGGSMQVVAATLPFPWAVVYDGRYTDHVPGDELHDIGQVRPERFWGYRFHLARTVDMQCDGTLPPPRPSDAPVCTQLCLNPSLDAELEVKVLEAQKRAFHESGAQVLQPVVESNDGFRHFLSHQPPRVDLLYLFCHATPAETATAQFEHPVKPPDEQACLLLDNRSKPLPVGKLRGLSRQPLSGQPLVMLNACGSTAGDPAFQSLFLGLFVGTWRARGFIGTDWPVHPVFADAFGRRLVQLMLGEQLPVARALAQVNREALAAGNPFGLIYALYASPDFTFFPGVTP